jgi:hypothetical protein
MPSISGGWEKSSKFRVPSSKLKKIQQGWTKFDLETEGIFQLGDGRFYAAYRKISSSAPFFTAASARLSNFSVTVSDR